MPIYFIQEVPDGAVKIGYTGGDPYARLASLQTGNSKPLRVLAFAPGGPKEERDLHERFADLRLQGEWFHPGPKLLGFIDGVRWSFPEEQKRKPREAQTLHGFSDNQVQFLVGLIEGVRIGDEIADAAILADLRSGILSHEELRELVDAKYLIAEIVDPEFPPPAPTLDGRRAGAMPRISNDAPIKINECIAGHHAAIAGARAMEEWVDGVHPDGGEELKVERAAALMNSEPLPHEVN